MYGETWQVIAIKHFKKGLSGKKQSKVGNALTCISDAHLHPLDYFFLVIGTD